MGLIRKQDCERAILQGIDFLRREQLPHGEFRTLVTRDEDRTVEPTVDPSCFTTAHIVSSLASLRRNECRSLITRATGFLLAERQAAGLWKFWSSQHPGFATTPSDMDDTAVVSLALQDAGIKVAQNRAILCANRNSSGLFYTWILRRSRHLRSPRCWLAILLGRIGVAQNAFFSTGEASPDDVDAVVNANAVRWLWDDSPVVSRPVAWLKKILEAGNEAKADRYYQSRHALYYAIARGARAGIPSFLELGPILTQRILCKPENPSPQTCALSLLALFQWEPNHPLLASMATFLVSRQKENGSWPAEIYYYGGWRRALNWRSSELTTAFCIEALACYAKFRK